MPNLTLNAEQFHALRMCFNASGAESFIREDPADAPIPPVVAGELLDTLNKAREEDGRVVLALSNEQHSALVKCFDVGADGLADYVQNSGATLEEVPLDATLNEVERLLASA